MANSDIQRVKDIFNEALSLRGSEREAYLRRACADDATLHAEVIGLLKSAEQTRAFLGSGEVRSDSRLRAIPLAEQPGTKIDRYKLLQQIGEGGFGVVFMAEQEFPVRRTVALKIIKLGMDTKQVVARFEAERQALAMMDHPNIAKVLDAGSTDTGRPYFVMELVKGVPITDYCDSANLSTEARLALFLPVCHAVQHAHQKGIIHRDIKPSNVLITLHDGTPVPKVIDFGIAKATHGRLTDRTLFTEYRAMVGTPEYMSPEQAEMSGLDIDTRADIYSLGVLLYELLTGVTPFDGKELREAAFAEIQRIIREVDPPKPSTRISTLGKTLTNIAAHRQIDPAKLSILVRGDLDWIVMKALEKDRTRRYDSATALAQDVQRHLAGEPVNAAPPSTSYRVKKFIRRNRGPVVAAVIVASVLVLGLVGTGLGLAWAIRAEREATHQKSVAIVERDKSVVAESEAGRQKLEAESQANRAEQLYGEGLISHGDALVTASEYRNAYTKFTEAREVIQKIGMSIERLDLSLVRLFRVSPPPLWTVKLHEEALFQWTVLESRNELITTDRSGNLIAIDLLTGATLRTFGNVRAIRSLCGVETKDGPVLIVGTLNSVQIVNAVTGDLIREAQDGRAGRSISSLPNGSAVSVDQGGTAFFWDFNTMAVHKEVRVDSVLRLPTFSPDGTLVAFLSSSSSNIYVYNTLDGTLNTTIELPPGTRGGYSSGSGLSSISFTPDGKAVLVGETDGKLVNAPLTGQVTILAKPHESNIDSICVSADGRRIFTSSQEGTVRVLEQVNDGNWVPSLTLVQQSPGRMFMRFLAGTGPKICKATFGSDPQDQGAVVGLNITGELSVWPVAGLIIRPNTLREGLSSSHDGLLLSGTSAQRATATTVEVRDRATGRTLRVVDDAVWSRSTAFGPDGKSFFCTTPSSLLKFDLFQSRALWRVEAHDGLNLTCIAASADGRFVATGSEQEGIARIWDSADGTLKYSLPGQGRGIWAVAFAPVESAEHGGTPGKTTEHLIVGPGDSGFITDWNFQSTERPRRAAFPYVRAFSLWPDSSKIAVTGGGSRIDLIDLKSFAVSGSLGPLQVINYNFALVKPGEALGNWAVSQGRNDFRVWNVEKQREEFALLRNASPQGANTMTGTPDGITVAISGLRNFDFTLPRLYRELGEGSNNLAARADYYARIGLWNWADQLLERAARAGTPVPEVSRARAAWMCGRYDFAKESFARAAKAGEVPQYYAELCSSVGDEPMGMKLCDPTPRAPDSFSSPTTNIAVSADAVPATDVARLKTLIGTDAVVEGIVGLSAWSTTGKVLNVNFLDDKGEANGLLCVVFKGTREKFDAAFGGDAAGAFANSRLRIKGKVVKYGGFTSKYKDWPQIVLFDPSQVTILK